MPRQQAAWSVGAALLLWLGSAAACINTFGTDYEGRRFLPGGFVGDELEQALRHPDAGRYVLQDAKGIIARARARSDFSTLTNLGALLIYQHQHVPAIRLFLTIERRYPGHAQTAANLGTALELAGQDAPALQWIRIGIRRDHREHNGSEWLHARILEAKIAARRDPTYLDSHSVAGVSFDKVLVPSLPRTLPAGNDGRPVTPWDLNLALLYQLHERTGFVKPRDPIVANLLGDMATLNLAGGPIENADVLYALAVTYGAKRDALMRSRQAYIQRVLAQAGDALPSNETTCGICPRAVEDK